MASRTVILPPINSDNLITSDANPSGDNIAVRRGNQIIMDFDYDGRSDLIQGYGNGNSEDQYLVGDWDGDGRDNIAVRRGNQIIMDFDYDGRSDLIQGYGNGNSEDQYLVGDWDGDGRDNRIVEISNARQITNNEKDDRSPLISEYGDVVWKHQHDSDDVDLYYSDYRGEDRQIATTTANELNPTISSVGHVVFTKELDDGTADIVYYDYFEDETRTVATTLNSSFPNAIINETATHVVYEDNYIANGEGINDLYLYDLSSDITTVIASDLSSYYNADFSGNYVVYESRNEAPDVFSPNINRFDLSSGSTINIADDIKGEYRPLVSAEGHVVYEFQYGDDDSDIKFYDNYSGNTITLADSNYNEQLGDISGNYVAWQAWDGNDWEIYRYNHNNGTTTQITDNQLNDLEPKVSDDGYVVWHRNNSEGLLPFDAYLSTGSGEIALAQSSSSETNPDIFGSHVTWEVFDGNDWEIYTAEIVDV